MRNPHRNTVLVEHAETREVESVLDVWGATPFLFSRLVAGQTKDTTVLSNSMHRKHSINYSSITIIISYLIVHSTSSKVPKVQGSYP